MSFNCGRIDLGLALTLVSSLLSLPFNKRYHIWLGVCFGLLTVIHTWQHRRQVSSHFQKERQTMGLFSQYKKLTNSARKTYLLQQVQVLHYMRGRVRLYSRHLVNNARAAAEIREQLETAPEVTSFSVNAITGSILIEYSPEKIAGNPLLQELEQLAAKQYGR